MKKRKIEYILYENENLRYVQYQVGFTSCTCRAANENYRSLIYVEINKDGTIKQVEFNYFGDSNPIPSESGSGVSYSDIKNSFIPQFIGKTESQVEETDSVAGATVTTENIVRVLDGLLEYHNNKYNS